MKEKGRPLYVSWAILMILTIEAGFPFSDFQNFIYIIFMD